jgi:predicted ATPase
MSRPKCFGKNSLVVVVSFILKKTAASEYNYCVRQANEVSDVFMFQPFSKSYQDEKNRRSSLKKNHHWRTIDIDT